MLLAVMDALMTPLYAMENVRFLPVRTVRPIGYFTPPADLPFPVEAHVRPAPGGVFEAEDLASGAIYVICYRPLHKYAPHYRVLARAYVEAEAPGFLAKLLLDARAASSEDDWVGTVGRLWTLVQLDPHSAESLDELAISCLHYGFSSSARGDRKLAIQLVRASGAALNALNQRFPSYASGHLRRAEFLAAAGDRDGALRAMREAQRLGLPPESAEDAADLGRSLEH